MTVQYNSELLWPISCYDTSRLEFLNRSPNNHLLVGHIRACDLGYQSTAYPTSPAVVQCLPFNFTSGQWNLIYSCPCKILKFLRAYYVELFFWMTVKTKFSRAVMENYCLSAQPYLSNANYPSPSDRSLYNSTYYTCNFGYQSSSNSSLPYYLCFPYVSA